MGESAAILLAGGSGSRMGGTVEDKTLCLLAGRPVLVHSALAFARSGSVQHLVVAYRDEAQRQRIEKAFELPELQSLSVTYVQGGAERQISVFNALQALPATVDLVFIHDGARPLIRPETIRELGEAARRNGAAAVARRVTDTIKEASPATDGLRLRTLDRSRLWAMETPQAFERQRIQQAYAEAMRSHCALTDDLAALEAAGQAISLLEAPYPNLKLTSPSDLPLLEWLLQAANGEHTNDSLKR
jgi:2-C-methyl-D-erythritol 4-phosphate cytidylyltransferase